MYTTHVFIIKFKNLVTSVVVTHQSNNRTGLVCHRPDGLFLSPQNSHVSEAPNTPLALKHHFITGTDQHLFLSYHVAVATGTEVTFYSSNAVSMFHDWDNTIGSSWTVAMWLLGIDHCSSFKCFISMSFNILIASKRCSSPNVLPLK